jgi:hypothetical protein
MKSDAGRSGFKAHDNAARCHDPRQHRIAWPTAIPSLNIVVRTTPWWRPKYRILLAVISA